MYGLRGMGATVNPASPNLATNPDTGQVVQCDFANLSNIFNSACWGYGSLYGPSPTINLPPPAVVTPPPPSVSTGNMTGAQAEQVIQDLTNQAVLQTQQNIMDANPPGGNPPTTPFCGAGSSQWIFGIDNCVLLGVAAAGLVGFVLFVEMTASGRRR
jgi:hypothetical protein